MRLALALVLAALTAGCARLPAPGPPENAEAAVRAVLARQVEAWNAGSVEGFMDGYARDGGATADSLRFASGGQVRYGWQRALDAYRRAYPDAAAMGTLAFSALDVRVLSARHALAFGRWRLDYPGGGRAAAGGLFTLLLERRPEGWRVVHDHTSSS